MPNARPRHKPTWDGVKNDEDLRLTLCDSPEVLSSLDGPAVGGDNVESGSDDRERHGRRERSSVLGRCLVVVLDRRLVDADSLGGNNLADLRTRGERRKSAIREWKKEDAASQRCSTGP